MKPILEVHPIQGKILKVLLFQTGARFRDLNPDKVSSDQFTFHLRSLLNADLLVKKDDQYFLTTAGKEFANRFDTEKIIIERQAKLGVGVTAIKKIHGQRYYLIQQRLKQPYYGYYGTITGKIRWGETITDAAKREFLEESGLVALKTTFVGILHKIDYSSTNELLEDKFFFRVRVDKFSGRLIENFEGGKNLWLSRQEIFKLDRLFPDLKKALDCFDQNNLLFFEKDYIAEGY